MINKLKELFRSKTAKMSLMLSCLTSVLALNVFASTPPEWQSTISTAFTTVRTDIMSAITTVLPIALGIMGTVIAIRFATKFFKGIAK